MATKKFVCKVCGYVHEGNAAPETCPLCKAPASAFEELPSEDGDAAEQPKKKLNTNSNAYIITYSVVMVVIVATLLAVAALALKPFQDANALNEKKDQIVQALTGEDDAVYEDEIQAAYVLVISEDGKSYELKEDKDAAFEALADIKETFESGNNLPLFRSKEGDVVIPLYGAGLWGPIWGYIALDDDKNTVKGIVLAHKGETPGLGAEITTEKHQDMYEGKKVFNSAGELVGITLVKGGADSASPTFDNEVDAISGGTKTSEGVSDMIVSSLKLYELYLNDKTATPAETAAAAHAEAKSEGCECCHGCKDAQPEQKDTVSNPVKE